MKIVNVSTGETIAEILTNHSMSLDEAIELIGEIHPEFESRENVFIAGRWFWYDDLDLVWY